MADDIQLGKWVVKPDSNLIVNGAESQRLDHIVMQLLLHFIKSPNTDLPKSVILKAVWGQEFASDEVLTVAVSNLRRALGDDAKSPTYIKTLPRVGYRFLATPSFEEASPNTATSFVQKIQERVGLRFGIVAILVLVFLLIVLAQVLVEFFAYHG